MIRLNVFIQVSESNRAAVLEAAKELVASSLKDKGCIAYDVFESATRNDVLMICETWKMRNRCLLMRKRSILLHWFPKYRNWLP